MRLTGCEKPESQTRFIRQHLGRIVIGFVLAAIIFGAMVVVLPYQRERRIAQEFAAHGIEVRFCNSCPEWIPELLRDKLRFMDRIDSAFFANVDLDGNIVPADLLAASEVLTRLQSVRFNRKISDSGLDQLKGMTRIRELDLQHCKQITDSGLAFLEGFTNLRRLSLSGTKINGDGLKHFSRLTNLSILDLSGTNVTDASMDHLKHLTNLTVLNLHHTSISDRSLEHLKDLTSLTILGLSDTQITNSSLAYLTQNSSLERLYLEGTQITDGGVEDLKNLTSLRELTIGPLVTVEARALLRRALPNCRILPEP